MFYRDKNQERWVLTIYLSFKYQYWQTQVKSEPSYLDPPLILSRWAKSFVFTTCDIDKINWARSDDLKRKYIINIRAAVKVIELGKCVYSNCIQEKILKVVVFLSWFLGYLCIICGTYRWIYLKVYLWRVILVFFVLFKQNLFVEEIIGTWKQSSTRLTIWFLFKVCTIQLYFEARQFCTFLEFSVAYRTWLVYRFCYQKIML